MPDRSGPELDHRGMPQDQKSAKQRGVNRYARSALVAVALLAGAALLLWPGAKARDAGSVLERAQKVLAPQAGESMEARRERLRRELGPLLTSDAQAVIAGTRVATNPDEICRAAAELAAHSVTVAHPEIRTDARDHATARFDVVISSSLTQDLHSEKRHATAELVDVDGAWRIRSLTVAPEARAEPEARP